ncbi:PAN domain protein [Cooperia oncophora]
MKEDYAAKENSREQIEMMQDPRFRSRSGTVRSEDAENGEVRSRRDKSIQEETPIYGLSATENPRRFFFRSRKVFVFQAYEPDPVSTVSHTRRGDRLFERRITEIGGKKVTVELGNKHLHGVDLIVRPGSVVHGSLPSGEEKAVVDRVRLDKRAVSGILIPYTPIDRKSSNFGNSLENPLDSGESLLAQSEDALDLPRSLSFDQQNFFWNTENMVELFRLTQSLIEMCFFVRTDTQLTGKTPIMKYIGETEPDCILECVRDKRCSSVNYSGTMSTCEIFDEIDIDSMQIQYQLGYTFYMPKQTDVHSCLKDMMRMGKQFSPLESGPSIMCDGGSSCRTSAVLNVALDDAHPPINYRLLPSKGKAACSQGSAVLFIRSAHSRDQKGKIVNTVSNISEDDCLFSCLTNKYIASSAEYDENGGRCSLSSEPRTNELTKHESTTLYEKICVTESVSNQCSGAAVDRMANIVLVGYMHDTATTVSIEECIERCVRSEIMLGFQCLSIMYYYEETVLNCILNDASVRTNPESVTDVNSTVVDYFGIDDCYGLPEAIDDRQKSTRSEERNSSSIQLRNHTTSTIVSLTCSIPLIQLAIDKLSGQHT